MSYLLIWQKRTEAYRNEPDIFIKSFPSELKLLLYLGDNGIRGKGPICTTAEEKDEISRGSWAVIHKDKIWRPPVELYQRIDELKLEEAKDVPKK